MAAAGGVRHRCHWRPGAAVEWRRTVEWRGAAGEGGDVRLWPGDSRHGLRRERQLGVHDRAGLEAGPAQRFGASLEPVAHHVGAALPHPVGDVDARPRSGKQLPALQPAAQHLHAGVVADEREGIQGLGADHHGEGHVTPFGEDLGDTERPMERGWVHRRATIGEMRRRQAQIQNHRDRQRPRRLTDRHIRAPSQEGRQPGHDGPGGVGHLQVQRQRSCIAGEQPGQILSGWLDGHRHDDSLIVGGDGAGILDVPFGDQRRRGNSQHLVSGRHRGVKAGPQAPG